MKRTWVVCTVGVVMACGKSSSPPPSSASESGSGSSSGSAEVTKAAPAPEDATYLTLKSGALVAIYGGKIQLVTDKRAGRPIPRKGGGLWIWVDGAVSRFDGSLSPIPGTPNGVEPRASGPDGTMWAADRGKLATYDGTKWTEHDLATIGLGANVLVVDYAFAPDGTGYVRGDKAIGIYKAGAWSVVAAPGRVDSIGLVGTTLYAVVGTALVKLDGDKLVELAKLEKFPPKLAAGPGAAYLLSSGGGKRVEGDRLVGVKLPYLSSIAFGPDGALYGIPLEGKRIVRQKPDGTVDRLPSTDLAFQAKQVVVDGRGRLWVVLEYGFALVDGDKVTLVTPGTVPEVSSNVERLVTTGKGGDLPDVGAAKLINLKGKMVAGGTPKAGVKLELCPGASSVFYGASPCAGKGFVRRATSAADGAFEITDVPLGGWHLIYQKSKDSWVFYWPDKCCGGLPKGGTFDMGDVEFGRSN
ncbi:MAG: hypothetical protein JNL83_31375 [Myxococcales bacterium]|nr:hypothetical protein [Myxococcales bacterium]